VSVDSFVLGTPIVTTDWPWHAPEFEYLMPGRNAVVTPDDVQAYADGVAALLRDPARVDELRRGCAEAAPRYAVEQMVDRFAVGTLRALAS
jgi:glycosyltransferase involved in cell wall biosynthesis